MNQISASDRAYFDVREKILLRVHAPGKRLAATETAQEFACSKVTITRVFQTLANEGYLKEGARATGIVRTWTDGELRDAIDMRAVLLTFAAQCCARRNNQLTLARLRTLTEVLESLGSTSPHPLDEISDCLALFETELCLGAGIESMTVALRNAFPPALIRKALLVADDISLDGRIKSIKTLVDLMERGPISEAQAGSCLEFDAIDAALLEENRPGGRHSVIQPEKMMRLRGKETTYARWATLLKNQLSTAAISEKEAMDCGQLSCDQNGEKTLLIEDRIIDDD